MNPIIGDKSLDDLDGYRAGTMTEVDKVRCHVSYALAELKAETTKDQNRRAGLLTTLEAYVAKGEFPRNENDASPSQRYPCFVDSSGTPCAVAYLMQQSGATALADAIAGTHKYESIGQIMAGGSEELVSQIQSWTATNELNAADLALIQPTYEFVAHQARQLFGKVEAKLREASAASTCLAESERSHVAYLMVRFGDKMCGGFGAPRRDIPEYLARVDKMEKEVPDEKTEVHELLKLLRKEVEGHGEGTEAADYEGLLPLEDLEHMENMKERHMRGQRVKKRSDDSDGDY